MHTEKIVLSQEYDDGIPKGSANKPDRFENVR